MIELRGFSAWITSDDLELIEFEPRIDQNNNTVTCWIAGPIGKTFIVHWRDHGSQVDSASYIYVDGFKVSGQFLYGYGEELRRGVRVGPKEERPFIFSRIQADDDVGSGPTASGKNVGSIVLEIKQIRRTETFVLDNVPKLPTVIRGHRQEGDVCVRYGEVQSTAVRRPTWRIQSYDPNARGPFVTFIFRYRTQGQTHVSDAIPAYSLTKACRSMQWTDFTKRIFRRTSRTAPAALSLAPGIPPHQAAITRKYIGTNIARRTALKTATPIAMLSTTITSNALSLSCRNALKPRRASSSSAFNLTSLTAASMSSVPLSQLSSLPTYASSSSSRLKSLYSDFTYQKQSNPTSYASNVDWWRRTLEGALLRGWLSDSHSTGATPDRLVLHATGVAFTEHFRVEGVGKPLSIPTVIVTREKAGTHRCSSLVKAELSSSKVLIPLPEFLNSSRSIYDPGWLPYRIASFVVGKPLWWALGQLGIVDTQASTFGDSSTAERWKKAKGDYVAVSLLEQAAERILERQRQKSTGSHADALYNMDSFREEFSACAFEDAPLSDLDVKVMLKFLERDKHAIAVIKFIEQGVPESSEITAVDSGLLALKTAVQGLQAQVDNLQRRIDERTQQISGALRQKRKEIALTHLRARKQLEQVRTKRLESLGLLESTLLRVETSAGDIEIMRSYESSTATLREILSHPLLQREKIDETMDAMASAHADAREVDDAIQMGAEMAQAEAGVDDSELDAELQALVQEVEKEKAEEAAEEQRKRLAAGELDVPADAPASREPAQDPEAARDKETVAA
ncbi:hypothetical protein BV20DRAFT_934733 [Pilatotrama ljubarskyi]|nr:hypothetical protein BV20DRAFT_934733 [Pilatotrama ljubarskyi]